MTDVQKSDFLFTVVVPVYNVEDFLEEALQSLEDQAGGYFDRSEVIIVDDGSKDSSFLIAQEFYNRHPSNVVLVQQENSGVSTAKNAGIDRARGTYIGFLDSDDRYDRNVLRSVAKFFDSTEDGEVDAVAFPMFFFDAQKGAHRLNNKFHKGDRVIDVYDEWQDVQLSSASTFVRTETLNTHGIRFDRRVTLGEDAKFITEAIMVKGRLGVTNAARYEYRKRFQGGSAIDGFQGNRKSYTDVVRYAWEALFKEQRGEQGIPKYVQNVACHDMEWRLKQQQQFVLDAAELEDYRNRLVGILSQIDDDVILSQRFLGEIHKLYALRLKYDEDPNTVGRYEGKDFVYRGEKLWSATRNRFTLHVDYLDYKEGRIRIHGRFTGVATPELTFGAFIDGQFHEATILPTPRHRKITNHGVEVFEPVITQFDLPLPIDSHVSFGVRVNDEQIDGIKITYLNATRMSNFVKSYRVFDEAILANAGGRAIHVQSSGIFNHAKREVMHVRKMAWAMLKGKTISKSVPFYRIAAKAGRAVKRKEIWIVSDRPYAAGDNGEAFFRYLMSNKPSHVRAYFSLKKSSSDYEAIREVGPVIDHEKGVGKLLFLLSDEVISSQADEVVLNGFGRDRQGVMDLYQFNFRFLQHGITQNDLSAWLNKYSKDIKSFFTASSREYEAIRHGDYGYSDSEIALTGFPRFDLLEDHSQNLLAIAPTWRVPLAGNVDSETGLREYSESFSKSEFFQFYQALMSDIRINDALEKSGMTAQLFLHPNHFANVGDFEESEKFTVARPPFSYKELFAKASVLVTDYSSVASDFAYLRKPVMYAQVDRDEFFGSASYDQGYFEYSRDGFGPVTETYEETVAAIVNLIERQGRIEPQYLNRINRFFAFDDRNSSQRVLNEILASKGNKDRR